MMTPSRVRTGELKFHREAECSAASVHRKACDLSISNYERKKKYAICRKIVCRFVLGLFLCSLFGMLCGCGFSKAEIQPESIRHSYTDTAMGTIINLNLYLNNVKEEKDEKAACEKAEEIGAHSETGGQTMETIGSLLAKDIMYCINQLEENTLSRRLEGSEISKINRDGGDINGAALSEQMEKILSECEAYSVSSEGAFDITVGQIVELWDIDRLATEDYSEQELTALLPKEQQIDEVLLRCGYEKMEYANHNLYLRDGAQLDLGSVGKGIALDEIHKLLEQPDRKEMLQGAVISLGGSILTYGEKPDGSPWAVAITDPFATSQILGTIKLTGEWCVSTSGDYERFVELDGKRYHHIIDPHTGYPADSGLVSVTILCKEGMMSDALSTACFVLGKEKGMALCEKYGAEALFVEADGQITMTEEMNRYFTLRK